MTPENLKRIRQAVLDVIVKTDLVGMHANEDQIELYSAALLLFNPDSKEYEKRVKMLRKVNSRRKK